MAIKKLVNVDITGLIQWSGCVTIISSPIKQVERSTAIWEVSYRNFIALIPQILVVLSDLSDYFPEMWHREDSLGKSKCPNLIVNEMQPQKFSASLHSFIHSTHIYQAPTVLGAGATSVNEIVQDTLINLHSCTGDKAWTINIINKWIIWYVIERCMLWKYKV